MASFPNIPFNSVYAFRFFPAIFFIKGEVQFPVAHRQEYVLGGASLVLLQPFVQPGQIQSHAFQIVLQNAAVPLSLYSGRSRNKNT